MIKTVNKRNIQFVIVIILILLTLPFISCDNKVPEQSIDEKFGFDLKIFEQELKDALNNNSWILAGNISVESFDTLKSVYATNNYGTLLISTLKSRSVIDSILEIIGNADQHGLNPERYNYSIIKNLFESSFNDKLQPAQRHKQLAQSEVLLIDAIIKYSSDMRHGVLNPYLLYEKTHFLPVNDSSNTKYLGPVNQNNILQYLENIQPKNPIYKNLQYALLKFKQIESFDWEQIPVTDKKIEVGQSSENIPAIYKKLVTLGLLDTALYKIDESAIYDSVLVNYVKTFQRINGLIDDGVIGKGTLEKLNITPEQYVEKIKLNLERLRWFDYSDTSRYILVNIPDFKVTAVENQKSLFEIKSCNGRKNNWQTVTLYGQLSYFVLNPTWSVPRSIIKEEIVNGLRSDSSYLKKRNFKVYKAGKLISLDGLTANDFSSSNSYTLVQDPGAGNALGKIKFMFTNPFGIYLHDTPTRAPFEYVNRAVSHGCVRLENPMKLAEYLLNNNSSWNLDFLKVEIGQKIDDPAIKNEYYKVRDSLRKGNSYGVTTEVKLTNKIPLFIDYYTTWVDEDGLFNYRDDVYSRDAILLENLKPFLSK